MQQIRLSVHAFLNFYHSITTIVSAITAITTIVPVDLTFLRITKATVAKDGNGQCLIVLMQIRVE